MFNDSNKKKKNVAAIVAANDVAQLQKHLKRHDRVYDLVDVSGSPLPKWTEPMTSINHYCVRLVDYALACQCYDALDVLVENGYKYITIPFVTSLICWASADDAKHICEAVKKHKLLKNRENHWLFNGNELGEALSTVGQYCKYNKEGSYSASLVQCLTRLSSAGVDVNESPSHSLLTLTLRAYYVNQTNVTEKFFKTVFAMASSLGVDLNLHNGEESLLERLFAETNRSQDPRTPAIQETIFKTYEDAEYDFREDRTLLPTIFAEYEKERTFYPTREALAKALVNRGCQFSDEFRKGQSATQMMKYALERLSPTLLALAIQRGFKIDEPLELNYKAFQYLALAAADSPRATELIREIIEVLKRNKANINEIRQFGRTPIWTAVEEGNFQCVKLFIEAGATVDGRDANEGVDLWTYAKGLAKNQSATSTRRAIFELIDITLNKR